MVERKPIFYDQERRRWRRTRRVLEIVGGLFTLVLIVFIINVFRKPELPDILAAATHWSVHAIPAKLKPKVVRQGRKRKVAALGKIPQNYDPLRAAFYVSYDSTSLASLQQHYHDIDLLIPEALHAVSVDGHLDVEQDPKLVSWIQTSQVELPIMPMVNNYDGKDWLIKEMAEMLANPAARQKLAKSRTDSATAQHDPGIVVDFEQVPDSSQQDFARFIGDLGSDLHAANLKLMVALPAADWSYDYKTLANEADAVILMNYDFHYPSSEPGPIASQDWFERNIENIVKIVPADKIVMGIANYSYDWPAKTKTVPHPIAQAVTFQQGIITAVESESDVTFDPDTLNPHYSYEDEKNLVHNVWMLDGVTAYNELRAAERAGVRGTALWRLGMEDPSMWSIWDATHPDNATRAKLDEVPPGYDLILEGDGDIWRITATPQSGRRTIDYDSSSDVIDDESYQTYPLSWRIEQMGASPTKLALTFDDGPNKTWPPQTLKILKEKDVPAAFFVIGESASQYPQIVRNEYQSGNDVGNHTFTHPDFETISKSQLQIELNLTELLLESNLGVKTLLFRPPYGIDHQPETASEIQMLPIPQAMGYIIVGARVDPHDWGEPNGGAPPTTDLIVQRVLHDATLGRGNIILMHDGGGNRSNTVAALPQIIDGLRAKGYDFVSVSDLLGQSRAQVMPPLSHQEWLLVRADAFIFEVFRWFRTGIAFIFIAGILLVSSRALIIGLLALIEKLRPAPADHPEYKPNVTVLIPAYNEEAAIVNTVQSALACDYPKLEILVVNDGSTDRTAELVNANFSREPRVRLISQPNRGKPAALNHGLAEASGEIIVSIDGDTIADPKVGAVAGNVKVMNRNRWLTRWQALEYITSQNLEKRAFDLLNCIPVVPGAVGAWRTDVVRSCGGFSRDTVAEATDLTMPIRRQGWKILYDEDAIGYTEAPETVSALIRQRFRWTFGTIQAVWKNINTLGRKRY